MQKKHRLRRGIAMASAVGLVVGLNLAAVPAASAAPGDSSSAGAQYFSGPHGSTPGVSVSSDGVAPGEATNA